MFERRKMDLKGKEGKGVRRIRRVEAKSRKEGEGGR
jgi:hypothetical protein